MLPVMEIIMPQQATGNVPAFLAKLWKMVDNPETDILISWSDEGTSFVIRNQAEFAKQLLPYYYKHSNMASFVRQLNMYGFHKVMSVDSGGLKGERDENEFAHPFFLRGQEHLLDQIKRKVSVAGARQGQGLASGPFVPSIKSEKVKKIELSLLGELPQSGREPGVNEVLSEVGQLKDRQEDLDGKLDTMKNENEALWREVLSLRQKHTQQQKIVNKLIQFLVALVQPRMGSMKRRYPTVPGFQLAIEEGGGSSTGPSSAKEPRLEPQVSGGKSSGPIIQEIETGEAGEMTGSQLSELLSNVPPGTVHEIVVSAPQPVVEHPQPSPVSQHQAEEHELQLPTQVATQSQDQQNKYRLVDPASVNPLLKQVVKTESSSPPRKRPVLHREISKEDFDTDINHMQKELDHLKDLLSGQITLDTSLVNSLFSAEDNLGNMNLFSESLLDQDEAPGAQAGAMAENSDLKLVTYNPSFFELTEEDSTDFGDRSSSEKAALDMDLNTPLIQDDTTDPLRIFYKK